MIGRGLRGASTITQQLVGNMHPDIINRRDKTLDRKLREQDAAREMERHYTKAQILDAYLNDIPFGHGWFGVDAAARHYFGKPAGRLSLAEAATLAALPRSATYYDPIRHPDRARARRNLVLTEMASQGYITADQAAAAKREPLVTVGPDVAAPAPYFVDAGARRGAACRRAGRRWAAIVCTALWISRTAGGRGSAGRGCGGTRSAPRISPSDARLSTRTDRPTISQGLVVAIDPATGACPRAGRRSRLSGFAIRSCAVGDPAARVRVQAVCLCSGAL